MPKAEFVGKFKQQVDSEEIGFFSDFFDVFSSSKNEYKGQVGFDSFRIKRRRRLFEMNVSSAIAKGTISERENILFINTEINGVSSMMIPYFIIVVVFYLVFISVFLASDNIEGKMTLLVLPFIAVHACFMLGIPYFMMRKATKRMKYDLERELFYMTKNKSNF
ncbi:MAG: hypothetical protein C0490_23430 [Marivirga sp.]|nr:hypothetical protein [Marivirga sp.]